MLKTPYTYHVYLLKELFITWVVPGFTPKHTPTCHEYAISIFVDKYTFWFLNMRKITDDSF